MKEPREHPGGCGGGLQQRSPVLRVAGYREFHGSVNSFISCAYGRIVPVLITLATSYCVVLYPGVASKMDTKIFWGKVRLRKLACRAILRLLAGQRFRLCIPKWSIEISRVGGGGLLGQCICDPKRTMLLSYIHGSQYCLLRKTPILGCFYFPKRRSITWIMQFVVTLNVRFYDARFRGWCGG